MLVGETGTVPYKKKCMDKVLSVSPENNNNNKEKIGESLTFLTRIRIHFFLFFKRCAIFMMSHPTIFHH